MASKKHRVVLMVDDDDDDWLLVKEAFNQEELQDRFDLDLRRLRDGVELLQYLNDCIDGESQRAPTPDLILLDLNMPRMDGREALKKIKSHPVCRRIPVIVFTTSTDQVDIVECYQCRASSFIIKPHSFESLKEMVRTLSNYWMGTVQLPGG